MPTSPLLRQRSFRFPIVLFIAFFLGCASGTKKKDREFACGSFCDRIAACIGPTYDDDFREKLCEMTRCESGCRSNARSSAGYVGAFQFDRATWHEVCGPLFRAKGLPHCQSPGARTDLCCASICAADLVARGMGSRWPHCN